MHTLVFRCLSIVDGKCGYQLVRLQQPLAEGHMGSLNAEGFGTQQDWLGLRAGCASRLDFVGQGGRGYGGPWKE